MLPPSLSTTPCNRRGIEDTNRQHMAGVTSRQASFTNCHSSALFSGRGCSWRLRVMLAYTCSIGFRSGLLARHGRTSMSYAWSCSHPWTSLLLCMDELSWKQQYTLELVIQYYWPPCYIYITHIIGKSCTPSLMFSFENIETICAKDGLTARWWVEWDMNTYRISWTSDFKM